MKRAIEPFRELRETHAPTRPKSAHLFWLCHFHYATLAVKPVFVKGKVEGGVLERLKAKGRRLKEGGWKRPERGQAERLKAKG
jgi:hypothetical protein